MSSHRILGLIPVGPLGWRRWQNFCANRRGFWSLWCFLLLFVLSLLGEAWVNDRPLLARVNGQWLFPITQTYVETDLGGDFEMAIDWRDPYTQDELMGDEDWLLWPPVPFYYDTIDYENQANWPSPPDARHWLGTDDRGRDVLARVVYGFRVSILFGLALTLLSSLIGVAAGAIQGYFGGWIDLVGQRFIEIWQGLPVLFILIILSSVIQPGFTSLLVIMTLVSWTALVGVVRAEFLRVRNFEYVKAARALGVGDATIMWRHVLPNAMVATMTFLPFILTGAVTTLTGLDFLGLGLPDGAPSLGELVKQGKDNLTAPWLGITAFVTLSLMLTLLIFIGEAVRDAFDPRKQPH